MLCAWQKTVTKNKAQLIGLKTTIKTKSHIAVDEVKRTIAKAEEQVADTYKQLKPIRILHLSDIHIYEDTDIWTRLQPLISDLRDKKDGLEIEQLDCLVVSGDLTQIASPKEFDKTHELLSKLIEEFSLSAARCVIIPGNHDLSWNAEVYNWLPERKIKEPKQALGQDLQNGTAAKKIKNLLTTTLNHQHCGI